MRKTIFLLHIVLALSCFIFSQEQATKVNILGKSGNNWILDKGAADGVAIGIKGYFWTKTKSGDKWYPMNIARFRVVMVEDKKCQVVLEGIGEGFSEKNFQWAAFLQDLNRPQAGKPEREWQNTSAVGNKSLSENMDKLFEKGSKCIEEKKFEEAVKVFSSILKMNPKLDMAYVGRSQAYSAMQKLDKAAEDLIQAIDLNIKNDLAFSMLCLQSGQDSPFSEIFIAHIDKTLKSDPAKAALEYGRYWAAMVDMERVNPDKKQEVYDLALQNYNAVLEINPKNEMVYIYRGSVYMGKGEFDKAIDDFSALITLSPFNEDAFMYRGIAYLAKGQHETALGDFLYVIKLNPKNADAHYHVAYCYVDKHQYDLAISYLTKALEINSNFTVAFNDLGFCFNAKFMYDQAIPFLTKAIVLDSSFYMSYKNLGNSYIGKKMYELALDNYNKALEINPKLAEAYYGKGLALQNMRKFEEAIKSYETFLINLENAPKSVKALKSEVESRLAELKNYK